MRRWLKRENDDIADVAIVLAVIMALTIVSVVLFGGQGAGAGGAGLGIWIAERSRQRHAAREAAGEPRGRLTVRGMGQAALVVYVVLIAMLGLALAIQHWRDDPLAVTGIIACLTALAGWAVARWLGRKR